MKKIAAGEFKARCLTLMAEVRSTREPLIITKRGKPVAKLVPADNTSREFLGQAERRHSDRGRYRIPRRAAGGLGVFAVILLDTPVLIWAVDAFTGLSRRAASEIRCARRGGGIAVSAISLWELASLFARGRIQAYGTIETSVRLLIEDVRVRPITPEIAALAAQFPPDFPRDPADRLISATARAPKV